MTFVNAKMCMIIIIVILSINYGDVYIFSNLDFYINYIQNAETNFNNNESIFIVKAKLGLRCLEKWKYLSVLNSSIA